MEQGTSSGKFMTFTPEIKNELKRVGRNVVFFLIGMVVLLLGLKAYFDVRYGDSNTPVQPATTQPKRSVIDTTVADLAARFNAFSEAGGFKQLALPSTMPELARNPVFHSVAYSPMQAVTINIEVENSTGKPFSLGFAASPVSQQDSLAAVGTMLSIGAAVLGKGDQAGLLAEQCRLAADSPKATHSTTFNGYEVYCSKLMGMGWMGGISLIDTAPKS